MSRTTLVVDNHPMILRFVAATLAEAGYSVRTAEDGLGALEVLKEVTPEVIFVDLVMPKIGGEKLCRIIRRLPSTAHVPLVVLSAIAAERTVDVRDFGADLCIAKGPLNEIGRHVLAVMEALERGGLDGLRGQTLGADAIFRRHISQELLSSKRHADAILGQMTEGIIELDRQGRVILANRAVTDLLELFEEDLLATRFADLFRDADRARVEAMVAASPDGLQAIDEKEPVALRGRWLSLRSFMVEDDEHSTIIVILEDVSERRRLAEQLERSRRMEAMLAGAVAHDLNNILGGVIGHPDLLMLQMSSDDPMRVPLQAIQNAGTKAAAVVQDLLSLARRGHVEMQVLDLNEVVRGFLGSAEHLTFCRRFPGVSVVASHADDLLPVEASAVHLSNVVMNLVFNAVEAVHATGSVRLATANRYVDRVHVGYEDVPEGEYVTLTVADSGVGMEPGDVERIFEPFYTKRTLGRSGTGLGMAVVWGTVKSHRGYVDVDSAAGTGTTFTLYLPACRRPLTAQPAVATRESICGRGESVLVVDDVTEQTQVATAMLRELGYDASCAASGESAVEMARERRFDLVVLDMIMAPGIDGLETYRRLIALRPDQRALIVTGFADNHKVEAAQRLGAGTCIRKPFLLAQLGAAVRSELDRAAG